MDKLVQLGCSSGHGYLLARPFTPERAERPVDSMAAPLPPDLAPDTPHPRKRLRWRASASVVERVQLL